MRDFMSTMKQTVEAMGRQEKERHIEHRVDPDEETFHVQGDGFYGHEKGFHDAEELRRK